jgi:Holliday junction resolvase-like predicted endonuclease
MDLESFCRAVDSCPDEITARLSELPALYEYVGLPVESAFRRIDIANELGNKVLASFISGHKTVWQRCRRLREALIQRHILDGGRLDPYFSILDHLQDAMRTSPQTASEVAGDWSEAIRHAFDIVRLLEPSANRNRERTHVRTYEVAKAAKRLQQRGYRLLRNDGFLALEPASEAKLIENLENIIGVMGGINVARRIFKHITPKYEPSQERYHLVRRTSTTGGGSPTIPFGYLSLLSVKHFAGTGSMKDTDQNWAALLRVATDYAAVLDVQGYTPSIWGSMDAVALLPYLQETALYDTLFCLSQIRGSDVEKIARGILRDYDFDTKYASGWSLNDALTVIAVLLKKSLARRGPVKFDVRGIAAACPGVPRSVIQSVVDEVFCHPHPGANQRFSKPTDAPQSLAPSEREAGNTFPARPLISIDRKTYWLMDRSMCAGGCLEALMAVLRASEKDFDGRLGTPIEQFLRGELLVHGIPSLAGTYVIDGEDGECDIVVETDRYVIFLEIKKKPLTRRAQAGSDAHVLLDLANSLLAAQVQAGWHEARLREKGSIELNHAGTKTRLELKGRNVERIAVSLMQFGGFQDRVLLKQFLEAAMNASFGVNDPAMQKAFTKFNALLGELREQLKILHPGEINLDRPFFHCWFLSVPQLLVLLDGVHGAEDFRLALWKTRHLITGSADFYYDNAWMRKGAAGNAESGGGAHGGQA